MTGRLSWSAIAAMFDLGGYELGAELSDGSALLALVGLCLMQSPDVWIDYGDGFDIQDAIALAIYELTEDVVVGDYEKITSVVRTSDVATIAVVLPDISEYHCLKIYLTGMLSNSASYWADHILMTFNADETQANYYSYGQYGYRTGLGGTDFAGNVAGIVGLYLARSDPPASGAFGNAEFTIFTPHSGEKTHVKYNGFCGGFVLGEQTNISGGGTYNDADVIEDILVQPSLGSLFLVDPESANEPDELRMTVYGLRK